jgi:hypothetical protein
MNAHKTVTMHGCESSGDAPSPQGESDAFVASFTSPRGFGVRRPGDDGVAATPSDEASLLPFWQTI